MGSLGGGMTHPHIGMPPNVQRRVNCPSVLISLSGPAASLGPLQGGRQGLQLALAGLKLGVELMADRNQASVSSCHHHHK